MLNLKKMKEAKNLYNKGIEFKNQGKNSEAVKWYGFYNKYS